MTNKLIDDKGLAANNLIDGKKLASKITEEIHQQVEQIKQSQNKSPGLAVILVGDDPASAIYVKNKRQKCSEVGIASYYYPLPQQVSQAQIRDLIQELNQDSKINGILVQLPLPAHINADALLECIHPSKDVDGFHPYNLGRLAQRRPLFRPCTPMGVMALLESINQKYKNHHAVIIGASNIVGRPMALELLLAGSTITICHRFTQDLKPYVSSADILVSAAGKAGLIKGEWIKKGATVIDVGMNRLENGYLVGDVEFEVAEQRAGWITPVPGGVGPMTVASLLKNTLQAYQIQNQRDDAQQDFDTFSKKY